jgi:glycosyltransferase involved in cell wall biosynthesis
MTQNIAYLLGHFPVASEYPILREMAAVAALGVDVTPIAFSPVDDPLPPELGVLAKSISYLESESKLGRMAAAAWLTLADELWDTHTDTPAILGRAPLVHGRQAQLELILSELKPDLIHAQFGHLGLLLPEDDPLPLVVSFRGRDVALVGCLDEEECRAYFARLSMVLVRCKDMARDLRSLGCPNNILRIHPTPIDLAPIPFHERTPPPEGEPIRILFVGRDIPKKNLAAARSAVDSLSDHYPLVLDVIHHGPHEDVLEAMNRAHLFILPSRTAPDGDKEGVPNVIKEAMASGLPVLSTRHAGIPECVVHGQNGLLADEDNPAQLADYLGQLLAAPEQWAEMGRKGREIVEARYDVTVIAPRLAGLYDEILNAE